jgi:hypothetical protein
MSGRQTEEKFGNRGGTARNDGLHSFDGTGSSSGSIPEAQNTDHGTGISQRGDERDVTQAPWFNPVDEISECPGGVCPVPWSFVPARPVVQEDVVNHPSHYTDGGIECIEAIEAQLSAEEYEGYLRGNCVKYLWRWKQKGGVQDLKKCRWYLDQLIKTKEPQNG